MFQRLADALRRRRRRPDHNHGAPPATVPGLGSGEETAVSAAAKDDAPADGPGVELAADAERAATADEPLPLTNAAVQAPAEPDDADARFDAARERLRSTIEPPPPDDDAA